MADAQIGDSALIAGAIQVLLATHNGERFLREQIDSILAQEHAALTILARDDGSCDGTPAILAEYAARHPQRFSVLSSSEASGSAKANFLLLLKAANAEYVCFADQDDVWLPDKVSRSLAAMLDLELQHGSRVPLLVFSDLRVVDEHLAVIAPSMWKHVELKPASVLRLERLISRSVVTGCTMLVNRRMVELARSMPDEAPMHDRWIALLACAMGAAAVLAVPTGLYRQHGGNVIGAAAADDSIGGLAARAAKPTGRRAERVLSERLAEALLRLHAAELPARSLEVLRAFLQSGRSPSASERVWLTLRYGLFRGSLLQNVLTLADLARSRSEDA